jgi:hypothetical protein
LIRHLRRLLGIALVFCPGTIFANSGIPGPLIYYAGGLFESPARWIAVNMAMCILVEAAIYRYVQTYKRPLLASIGANVVSLVVGIPLALLGLFDPTMFLVPTVASIFVEYYFLRSIARFVLVPGKPVTLPPVVWGNIVTNLIMAIYVVYAVFRS